MYTAQEVYLENHPLSALVPVIANSTILFFLVV